MSTDECSNFNVRLADEADLRLVFELVKELASYENLLTELNATEESLRDAIFVRKIVEVIIAEYEGTPAGYAMYYYNFSSFIGKPGIFLEDIYVKPEFRGKGIGRAFLVYLSRLAQNSRCWGLEWACLNWNKPSIDFYESIGAQHREEWRVYRLKGNALNRLAESGSFAKDIRKEKNKE